jgi:transcriptional regulator with XRE-family HTH domain
MIDNSVAVSRLIQNVSLKYQERYMESVRALIDKASKVCGSDTALAERMGIDRPNISLMRAGKRAISPATAAELADIAGDDAREAAIAAILESAKGTRRESVLREILGKAIAAGVAGLLVFSYSGDSISATEKIAKKADAVYVSIHRIYSTVRRAAARLLAALRLRPCGEPSAATC